MNLLSLVVIETDGGAEVRLRDADGGEAYPDVYAALDSLLSDSEFSAREPVLRDESGSPVGVWRWLDATAEEPAPAADGSQVTRDLIARMAARLNSGSPVPIDGVSSEPHQQLYQTGTHADGYGHVGVEVQDRSGRWHLWLYAELGPEAARVTSQGLVWSGSIGFTSDGRLLQHALTNVPAVEGLRPNNATRHAARRVHTRSLRITMTKPKTSQRGPALDLLAKIAAVLGVSMEDEKGAESFESPLMDALYALKGEARIEGVLEAAAGGAAAAPDAEALDATRSTVAARAMLEGFADEAAQDLFTSEALAMFRDIFGKADASPAEVLDLAKASLAAFKGAIGEAAPPGDAAAMSETDASARSALVEVPRLRAEVAKLASEVARRDTRDGIAKRATDAKAALTADELEQLTADVLSVGDPGARERVIERAIKAAQSVPTGDVFARNATGATKPESFRAAWESLVPGVEKSHPGIAKHVVVALAQKAARARFPQFNA